MSHTTKTLPASQLIEDFSIYPRNCVFDGHVYELAETIRAGVSMPPVVACSKTFRITDGFHRRRAEIRVNGDDAPIEVMLVDFASDAEMVCDAIARNSVHGRRLATADIARCAVLAKQFRISREKLAGMLHITRDRLTEITAQRMSAGNGKAAQVLRRPMAHLAGRKLTKAQSEIVEHVGGQTAMHHATVLVKLIESKSLPDDDRLVKKLQQLHSLLEGMLVA